MRDIRDIVRDIDAISKGEVTEATVPNIVEVYKMVKKLEKRVAELESGQEEPAPAEQPAPEPQAAAPAPAEQPPQGAA